MKYQQFNWKSSFIWPLRKNSKKCASTELIKYSFFDYLILYKICKKPAINVSSICIRTLEWFVSILLLTKVETTLSARHTDVTTMVNLFLMYPNLSNILHCWVHIYLNLIKIFVIKPSLVKVHTWESCTIRHPHQKHFLKHNHDVRFFFS